jgi:uncharacterized membrane protein
MPTKQQLRSARWLTAASFVLIGLAHFARPRLFMRIMPPYLPAHRELVLISGLFEIIGGLGVLFPQTRRAARYGLLALTLAVYPANIHMARNPEQFAELAPAWVYYVRLPFQFVIMYGVWYATQPTEEPA